MDTCLIASRPLCVGRAEYTSILEYPLIII
jgi:hypothetical protein